MSETINEIILTDEQIQEISDTVEEATATSITKTTWRNAEEERKKFEERIHPELKSDIVAIDRETGRAYTINEFKKEMEHIEKDIDDNSEDELQSWEDMLEDDTIKDFNIDEKNIEITKDIIKAEMKILFPKLTLYDNDYKKLINAANRYRNNEHFSYFNSLPDTIKNQVRTILQVPTVVFMEETRIALNTFAENILNSIIEAQYMDKMTDAYQEGVNAASLKGLKNIQKDEYWTYIRKFFNHDILDKAKEYEDKDEITKAERCRGIFYAFKESYNFSIMKDLYMNTGKLKVKKIMIEKFKRTCDEFNNKYENNSKTIIDINQLLKVLDRIADKKFDIDIIKEFICVFIKYTQYKNMSPDNIVDHTFMYYFIFNIVTINTCNPDVEEDVQFKDQLINNINEFLQLIVDKRQAKERMNN